MATISYPTTLDDQLLNMNFVDESSLQTKMLSYSDYNLLPNNNNSISNSDEQFQYGVLPSQQNYQLQQQQFSVPSSAAPALFDSMPSSSSTTNVSVTDSIPNNNASAPMFNTDMFKDLDYSQPTQSSSIDYGLGEDLNSYSSILMKTCLLPLVLIHIIAQLI